MESAPGIDSGPALSKLSPVFALNRSGTGQLKHRRGTFRLFAKTCFCLALLVVPVSWATAGGEPLCVLSSAEMPASWKPWGETAQALSPTPWSEAESADVAKALRKGLDELQIYYAEHRSAVSELGDDAAASFFEIGYGQTALPDIKTIAQARGEQVLGQLVEPFLRKQPDVLTCSDYESLLPLALYARRYEAASGPPA